jgi:hypothetical protein
VTKQLLFILLCCICTISVQKNREIPPDKICFGVRIAMGPNSQLTSFIALRYSGYGVLREKRSYNTTDFIKIISGEWPSNFNPEQQNLFVVEGINGGVYKNKQLQLTQTNCPVFDSLWKLRWSDYPFQNGKEKGWSKGLYKPSATQEIYLSQRYHFKQLDFEYIVDTNFWNLLRDVSDLNWIEAYKALP